MGWDRKLDDEVPGIKTLRDTATYVVRPPKAEQWEGMRALLGLQNSRGR
jgi:hypothetical protein